MSLAHSTALKYAKKSKEAYLLTQKNLHNAPLRSKVLAKLSLLLKKHEAKILKENQKDLKLSHLHQLTDAQLNRLELNPKSMDSMRSALKELQQQPDHLGEIVEKRKRPNGLVVQKRRVPIGSILMIFESRPNVIIDTAALSLKSGNAVIMKGGSEAQFSNRILGLVVQEALAGLMPEHTVQVLNAPKEVGNELKGQKQFGRDIIQELIQLDRYLDLAIPRGGESLIRSIRENSRIPVIAHDKGLCHMYVHHDALKSMTVKTVVDLILNSKVQRPGVCNALETLLVNEKVPAVFWEKLREAMSLNQVEIRACAKSFKLFKGYPLLKKAQAQDFKTEYLAKILSLKMVKDVDEAIDHIQTHTSHHTEAVVTASAQLISRFQTEVDCSCLVVNASTRFNDGGQLGLGAELGIATSKLHAYGPMGVNEMTTTRFEVLGHGQFRSPLL